MSLHSDAVAQRTVKLIAGVSALALSWGVAGAAFAAASETDQAQTVDEVLVTGQRLGTANAISAQRRADGVVNVLSADDMGKLPDANVADALARLPGINVIVNQDTGEGEYVTVRGFAGTFNAYSINGVRVALTDTDSRQMSMTVLPPNGLQAIAVSKTLTPDMDGDAIGGSIDFRTPNAFDFKGPVARMFASYGANDRARDQGEASDNYLVQADFGRRLKDERFGVFASVNYGRSHGVTEETENDGEWEPYIWRKNGQEAVDERSMFLPGIDLDYRRNEQKRYGGNVSLDYRGADHDLYLRGQFNRFERISTNDWTDYRSRPTLRLVQVNDEDRSLSSPEKMIIGHDPVLGAIYGYTPGQIVDADGDGRITDADRTRKSYWSLHGRSGVWNPQAFQFSRNMDISDQNQTLATVNLGGVSRFNALELSYDLSYSFGERENPDNYSVGYNCDACAWPLNATGLLWSSYDGRFPTPQLPAFAAHVERDPSLLPLDGASHSRSRQKDERVAFKLDARYQIERGPLEHIRVGGKYLQSKRDYDSTPIWDGDFAGTPLDGKSLAGSGLIEREVDRILGGRYYYGAIFNRERVIAAIRAAEAANPAAMSYERLNQDDKQGQETIYAAYALAQLKWGDLQVIAGGRYEQTEVKNTFWSDDGANSGFDSNTADYGVFLPSVTATYRPNDHWVYRAAAWTSFSRPEYGYISGGQSVTRNPVTNEIIAISRGNPDLKPAEALNLDLSAEFYPDRSSVLSAGLFYKKIDNFIFTNGSQVDATTTNGFIEITQPKNGDTANITGVEFNFIKSFDGMAAPFDGFGFEGNLTLQTSEGETGLDYRKGRKISFVGAPDLMYNASLTYQKYGFEARLSYNYQGEYVEDLRDNAIDKWVQPTKTLDFHSRYNVNDRLAVDFDVQNILDGHRYYTTKGESPSYMKDYMEPGRTFLLRMSYSY